MQAQGGDTETIELRLTPKAELVLALAAKARGCPIDEFVLQSALAHARETLPDRQEFGLDAEQWTMFMAALDAPPTELPRLRRLSEERDVFEKGHDKQNER
jgi:uncharacterized protein (DUF1778 family)